VNDAAPDPGAAADPAAVVVAGPARFTALSERLLRLEHDPLGRFEDRPTLAVVTRRRPAPPLEVARADGWLTLRTPAVEIRYREGAPFGPETLAVTLDVAGRAVTWRPGDAPDGNLGGTLRTLDDVSGRTLGQGVLSRDGWALVDDSDAPVLAPEPAAPGGRWPRARPPGVTDWYLFAHGRDYRGALRDLAAIGGSIPLPPRWALGAWWSRYWPYSDAEARAVVAEFRERGVPLDVLVLDLDWHLPGWTGYTWDPDRFPDPPAFLAWARSEDLRVGLNLHPHEGVGPQEAAYADVCRAVGRDPAAGEPVPFDCADPAYARAYLELLHRPREREGVDVWWIDWQQGTETDVPGLDPLAWLNHLHWTDAEVSPHRAGRRPLLLSRWGGLGGHRYPLAFSGDAISDWASLAFQPELTATAGNVLCAWWSHDVGGHLPGPVEPELYARWVQWGALSPALRLHATRHERAERRPWAFPTAVAQAAEEAIALRYALLPYLYTAARAATDEALPLCRPLYLEWPDEPEAYGRGDQYLLGDDLLVAPVLAPAEPASDLARRRVWLPPGRWVARARGEAWTGPREVELLAPLDDVPVFVREGAVLPLARPGSTVAATLADPLVLEVWGGDAGEASLYEDDGETTAHAAGERSWTPVRHERRPDGARVVTIGPRWGGYVGAPLDRPWIVRLRDAWPAATVQVDGRAARAVDLLELRDPEAVGDRFGYDPEELAVVVALDPRPADRAVRVVVEPVSGGDDARLAGLGGELALLEGVADLLGPATPPAIEEALAAPAALVRDPAGAPLDRLDPARRAEHAAAVAASDAPEPARTAALARLLGLSCALRLEADGDAARVVAEARTTPPRPDVGGRLVLAAPAGWAPTAADGASEVAAPVADGGPAAAELRLRPGDGLPTAVVAARLVVTDPVAVVLPAEAVLCPGIDAWSVVGPFDDPWTDGRGRAFPPEDGVDLAATYPGKAGPVGWRIVRRRLAEGALDAEHAVDLHAALDGPWTEAAAYAFTTLEAEAATGAVLAIGSSDGVVAWLNGEEVHAASAGRPYVAREVRVPVRLRPGRNDLLLKLTQGEHGPWRFAVHVEDAEGRPRTDVVVRLPDGGPEPGVGA